MSKRSHRKWTGLSAVNFITVVCFLLVVLVMGDGLGTENYTGNKMKFLKYFLAVFSFSFLSFSPIENASKVLTTNCHQTFHFFFLSQGSPTFWIGEDLSGECEYSRLLNISIDDSSVSISQSELKEYNNWGTIPKLSSLFRKYEEQSVEFKDNIWQNKDLKIYTPVYNPLLAEEFNEHIRQGGSNAYSWIKINGKDGIILPEIDGIRTELLFSYKTGLYINYEISEVHYFPNSYIIIFTNQPLKAVGLDTMHGFFIFKIRRDT